MNFSMLCNTELFNEVERIVNSKPWHPKYKSQLISRVVDVLERGNWVRTKTGGYAVAFHVRDVKELVEIVADRD